MLFKWLSVGAGAEAEKILLAELAKFTKNVFCLGNQVKKLRFAATKVFWAGFCVIFERV